MEQLSYVSDVNASYPMEDFKQIELQHTFVPETETKMLPWETKTGEIFRNSKGQYAFMCFHCYLMLEDFGEIISHCNSHFDNDEKYHIDVPPPQPPEQVFCPEIDIEPTNKISSSSIGSRKVSNITKTRNAPPARGRGPKRFLALTFPQNCPICDVWCEDFRDHINKIHDYNGNIYQCFVCSKFFKTLQKLRSHMSYTHNKVKCYHCEMEPPVTNPSDARRHKCLFCKEWFPNHVQFKIHFKDAHDKDADHFFHKRKNCNIFTCYVCEREFPLRYYLSAHMKIHHEKFLRHQCPSCGKRVRTFGQLTQHLKTHEGKIYTCDQCDKQFPFYARLRLHKQCHQTELKYKCDVCPKAFKMRKYLTVHRVVHSAVKKYACKFCEATFNFQSGRRAHEKSQHKAI